MMRSSRSPSSSSSSNHNNNINKNNQHKSSSSSPVVSVFCRFAPVFEPHREQLHVAIDGDSPNCTVTAADLLSCSWVQIGCNDVIDPSWTQEGVFDTVARPVLSRLTNSSSQSSSSSSRHEAIIAFGQSSCGKTFTIGLQSSSPTQQKQPAQSLGLLPRSLEFLFNHQNNKNSSSQKMSVEITCVEIYNEIAHDLVAVLRGGEFAASSTYKPTEKMRLLKGLQRARCESLPASLELIKRLLDLRRTSSTANNDTSSRSHLIIRVILPSFCNHNSITFGDLAGSECLRYTSSSSSSSSFMRNDGRSSSDIGGGGDQQNNNQMNTATTETKNINVSLLALKKVVRALRNNSTHIPYKDSMLTTILEPCFNSAIYKNNTRSDNYYDPTTNINDKAGEDVRSPSQPPPLQIILCCSGYQRDSAETLATLRFGAEASAIRPIGMLNPLTLRALKQREMIEQQQQNKKSSSLTATKSGSTSRSGSPSVSSKQFYPVNDDDHEDYDDDDNDDCVSSSSSSSMSQEEQQQENVPSLNNNNSHQQQHHDQRQEETKSTSRAPSSSSASSSDENIASMKRLMAALVDENATLRMQVASQKQELEESAMKTSILIEKSNELLDKFEKLHRECEMLRKENAELKKVDRLDRLDDDQDVDKEVQQQQQIQTHPSASPSSSSTTTAKTTRQKRKTPLTDRRNAMLTMSNNQTQQEQQEQQRRPVVTFTV